MLFKDVDFEIKYGERVFLLGANGCGKSSLMKLILGKLKGQGNAYIADWLKIGYFDQLQELRLTSTKTVMDFVWDDFPKLNRTQVQSALAMFKLYGELLQKPVNMLSGGEAAKVILLKIMLEGPNLLLLDEPTNHLDLEAREGLIEALSDYKGTMLIISHDRAMINSLGTKLMFLHKDGMEIFSGSYDEWRESRAEGSRSGSVYYTETSDTPAENKTETVPKVNTYKQQKDRQSRLRKAATQVKKLEAEIEAAEKEAAEINKRLAENAADYKQVMEDSQRLSELEELQMNLMERWEEAEKALAQLEAE